MGSFPDRCVKSKHLMRETFHLARRQVCQIHRVTVLTFNVCLTQGRRRLTPSAAACRPPRTWPPLPLAGPPPLIMCHRRRYAVTVPPSHLFPPLLQVCPACLSLCLSALMRRCVSSHPPLRWRSEAQPARRRHRRDPRPC